MNEVIEVSEGGKAKRAKKSGAEGSVNVEGQIGRMLVRAIWAQEWAAANPEAKNEERKAAWKAGRAAALEANLKPYRSAINALARAGVTMTLSAETASADEDDAE